MRPPIPRSTLRARPRRSRAGARNLVPVAVLLLSVGCRDGGSGRVEAVGTIELVETDVAPLATARIVELRVEEGEPVQAGDTIAVLALPTTGAELDMRRSQSAAADAGAADLAAGAREAELARLESERRALAEEAARLARDAERQERLFEAGAVSAQEAERTRTAAEVAAARLEAATETLRLARQGTRPAQVAAARAQADAARAAERAAVATADALVLVAPSGGVVVGRHAEPGEIVPAGRPVVTLGDPARPWVRVYVDQGTLPLLAVGDSATAVLDAFPDRPLPGRITALATQAEFTPRVALTEDERADLLFGVRVALGNPNGLLRAGLPVTVRLPVPRERADRLAAAGGGAGR